MGFFWAEFHIPTLCCAHSLRRELAREHYLLGGHGPGSTTLPMFAAKIRDLGFVVYSPVIPWTTFR